MKISLLALLPLLSLVSCASFVARRAAWVAAERSGHKVNLVLLRCFGSTTLPMADKRPDQSQLSITTYNVDGLTHYDPRRTNRVAHRAGKWSLLDTPPEVQKMNEVACTLDRLDSDIVLLQEIDRLHTLKCLKEHLRRGSEYEAYFVQNPNHSGKDNVGLLTRITPSSRVTHLQDSIGGPQEDNGKERVRPPSSLVCDIPLPDGRTIHLISPLLASLYGETAEMDRHKRLSEAFLLSHKIWWAKYDNKLVIVAGTLNDDDPEHPGASTPFYYHPNVLKTIKGDELRNAAYMSHIPQPQSYSNDQNHMTSHILVDKGLLVKHFSINHPNNKVSDCHRASKHHPVSAIIEIADDDDT